jgi:hypothetical protein
MAKTIGQLTAEPSPAGANEMPISVGGVARKVTVTNLLNTAVTFSGTKTLADAANIAVGTGTGTKIGTATTQKLGFFDATPVAQAASTADLKDAFCALGFMANSGASPLNLDSGALTCGTLSAGAATATSLASTGAVTSSSATAGIGYATGAGGTVTQTTNKSTSVTLNNVCGTIALSTESDNIASGATKTFTLSNNTIDAGDLLVLNHVSGGTAGAYALNAQCGADSASINVTNISSSGKNENNVVIRFAVIKAVAA